MHDERERVEFSCALIFNFDVHEYYTSVDINIHRRCTHARTNDPSIPPIEQLYRNVSIIQRVYCCDIIRQLNSIDC